MKASRTAAYIQKHRTTKGFREKSLPRHTLSGALALQAMFCYCSAVTAITMLLQPTEPYILAYLSYRSFFIMPLLNFLPIFGACLLLFFLTQNLAASMGVSGYLALAMATVNRVKLLLRGDPLLHWDFSMVAEVLGIAGQVDRRMVPMFLLSLLLFAAVFIAFHKKVRVEPLPGKRRAVCALACAAALLLVNQTAYKSPALNKWLGVYGSFYNQADIHNSKGNLYSFLYNYNAHKNVRPAGYDPGHVLAAMAEEDDASEAILAQAVRPHIIMVMMEAFSDISEQGAFDFSGRRDPLATFKALGQDGIAGSIIVPSRGGGTADTEFDVLTGRVSRYFRTAPYSYRLVTGPTEALPSLLAEAGYASFALHPGHPWFYNRQNVYPNLGFGFSVFEDAFPRHAYMNEYISDAATFDMLLDLLRAHMRDRPGVPLFSFCLTIQNHAAYHNRYLAPGTYLFDANTPLDEEDMNILSNYFAGVIDGDDGLRLLADYLDTLHEPAVIVFFGDHLPALTMELFDQIIPGADAAEGGFVRETRLYRTPFLIWENSRSRETLGIIPRAQALAMPENMTVSSNYLGAYLLELLGLDRLSPFFAHENALRAKFPVLLETLSFLPDGTNASAAPAEDLRMLKLFQDWVYYRSKNE